MSVNKSMSMERLCPSWRLRHVPPTKLKSLKISDSDIFFRQLTKSGDTVSLHKFFKVLFPRFLFPFAVYGG